MGIREGIDDFIVVPIALLEYYLRDNINKPEVSFEIIVWQQRLIRFKSLFDEYSLCEYLRLAYEKYKNNMEKNNTDNYYLIENFLEVIEWFRPAVLNALKENKNKNELKELNNFDEYYDYFENTFAIDYYIKYVENVYFDENVTIF